MMIRPEEAGDEQAIHDLTLAAFGPMSFSDGTEARIVDDLRKEGDLTISLVALDGAELVGHAAFSPVAISGAHGGWYGLGPISVRPDRQRAGIGSALIHEGLSRLMSRAAKGCVVVGNPDYYGRFGFRSDGKLTYGELCARYVQWLPFGDEAAAGKLTFSPAFER